MRIFRDFTTHDARLTFDGTGDLHLCAGTGIHILPSAKEDDITLTGWTCRCNLAGNTGWVKLKTLWAVIVWLWRAG